MSAFMLPEVHIDYLLTAALRWSNGSFRWGSDPEQVLTKENASEVGGMLLGENRASVNCRYRQSDPSPAYGHRTVGAVEPLWVLSGLSCFDYQSCEHAGWETSSARRFSRVLRWMAWRRAGPNAAPRARVIGPWVIDNEALANTSPWAEGLS